MNGIRFVLLAVACVGLAPACSQGPVDERPEPPTRGAPAAVTARPPVAIAHDEDDPVDCPCKHDSEAQAEPEAPLVEVAIGHSPVRGAARAAATVIVFSDYQCPYCAKAEKTIRALEERYGSDLRIVFKNLALPMHADARLAAKAGLAADRQGKFWEYHDALFEHQVELDRASLERYAEDLGLDMRRFRADLDSESVEAQLAEDAAEADRLGVRGTPTFFVNGRRITGAQPLDVFRGYVDAALPR